MNTTLVVFSTAVLAIIAGCESQPIERTEGVSDENKAFVHRWIEEGFNGQNLAVVDELFAQRFSVNGQTIGRDGLKGSMTRHLMGFPDLHVTIDDIIAEGDKVGVWYTAEGTHRGEFAGIAATGNHVKWSGFDLLTVEHRKISQARFLSDFFGLMTQLGANPQNHDGVPR
jgi:predicted ester cyclase